MMIERLVYPVPDSTTADEVATLDRSPVIIESSHGIPHGVCILRDVERILNIIVPLSCTLHPSDRRILIGSHIHDVVITLILDRT